MSNKAKLSGREIKETFDVVVAGGGLAGVCAAIASARHGCTTALVQDRPVLGGNSSSEIRVPPGGAATPNPWARETGIIEELQIEDRARNHDPIWEGTMNSQWDMALYETVRAEPNLVLHLNTSVRGVEMKGKGRIACVVTTQAGSERTLKLHAKQFVDCTGDGTVGGAAGAEFRHGREARREFDESLAPPRADSKTQGNSIFFRARDVGRPVPFTPPPWAEDYPTEESLLKRHHNAFNKREYAGYWWIEVGAPFDTIDDNEMIRNEILRHLMGVWDHIKNHGNHGAENLVLDWIGMVPGKRESRRLVGDHILTENDVRNHPLFPDRVAYGGWFIDVHTMGGILAKGQPPEPCAGDFNLVEKRSVEPYSIPFRCLYSRNIENLLMAGRDFSCTHIGLGSPRLMLTCAIMGQAAGTAAALCVKKKAAPRAIAKRHIAELQQTLLKDGCFIPELPNEDPDDMARSAKVAATSCAPLALEPQESATALSDRRSQIFPITAQRLNTISLHLKSSLAEPREVRLEFCPASSLWEYNEEPPSPPPTAAATVPPNSVGWVVFHLNATTRQGLYRINLPACPGVSWSNAQPEPGVAAFYRRETWKRWAPSKVAFAMRLDPPSSPFGPENMVNGVARPLRWTNLWVSDPAQPLPQAVTLDLGSPRTFNAVYLTFDTYLHVEARSFPGLSKVKECVSDYEIQVEQKGGWKTVETVVGNYQRRRIHRFKPVNARKVRINVTKTNGSSTARIYEVRIYDEK
ncbi:MAG: FAD-dependent oxidoreductase [Planctomycetota bacterium]